MSNSLKTKHALANSLKTLMKKTELNKISVKNIVDECNLNRQTFYYHFEDVYDLIDWIYKTEALNSIKECDDYEHWTDGLIIIFKYIEKNKEFCLNTLNSLGRSHLNNYLYLVTNELISGVIDELSIDMNVKKEDKEFMSSFYTVAFKGLIIKWMDDGMKEKPEEVVTKLNELIDGNFLRALKRYNDK
ncbi:transcriptional regulator, TetR family [Clostridium baratii str. Sullivan]|uniref:Transcriptional regulator, TetR family n=1 Tax=Clostridium baratii str. Sullivan TaxID=1415775 RepID=A0A0A7FVE5_9CLOT|nr:TetR-like C-terminal domain-containing protein [Clostridium baratii]AIY83558.1 transcriptional regulator, TetR family [Clostridium baratii str. Sullivan]